MHCIIKFKSLLQGMRISTPPATACPFQTLTGLLSRLEMGHRWGPR